ncbi:MAG: hypothetical protein N3F04_07605 [Candidatus Nezhaarchaeota archaeon]|nr:hypothetical protein [Candidatus Nezhaarchaeota archaeon]
MRAREATYRKQQKETTTFRGDVRFKYPPLSDPAEATKRNYNAVLIEWGLVTPTEATKRNYNAGGVQRRQRIGGEEQGNWPSRSNKKKLQQLGY